MATIDSFNSSALQGLIHTSNEPALSVSSPSTLGANVVTVKTLPKQDILNSSTNLLKTIHQTALSALKSVGDFFYALPGNIASMAKASATFAYEVSSKAVPYVGILVAAVAVGALAVGASSYLTGYPKIELDKLGLGIKPAKVSSEVKAQTSPSEETPAAPAAAIASAESQPVTAPQGETTTPLATKTEEKDLSKSVKETAETLRAKAEDVVATAKGVARDISDWIAS